MEYLRIMNQSLFYIAILQSESTFYVAYVAPMFVSVITFIEK